MNEFKEWLSDYLRYFILLLALLLALGAIFLGVKLYQSTQAVQGDPDSVTILKGTEQETSAETKSESETEAEAASEKETVLDTETDVEKEIETDTETDGKNRTETDTELKTEADTEIKTEPAEVQTEQKPDDETETTRRESDAETETERLTERSTEQAAEETVITIHTPETQPQTEQRQTEPRQTEQPQTEQRQTEPPKPVNMTMTETCYIRSYADYGDNIIGEYPAGTAVVFLEDVDGWAKVRVDGRIGYMGTRFLTTEPLQTEAPQTEPPQTEPPQPVYMTMTGTCYIRSYADYGDNIIGEYPAGTVVEFLEDVGGWYKVQINGMVGYMGARFFQ